MNWTIRIQSHTNSQVDCTKLRPLVGRNVTAPSPFVSPHCFGIAEFDRARVGRFAAWRSMIATVFDVGARAQEISSFEGDFVAWCSGRFVLSEAKSSRIHLLRSPDFDARSRFDHFAIRLAVSGDIAGLAGSKDVDVESGDVLFIDLSQSLNLLLSGRGGMTSDITLWVPRTHLLTSIGDDHELHGLVVKGNSPAGALIGACLRTLATHVSRMSVKEMDALASGSVELTARAVAPTLETATASGSAVPLASLVTIRRFIDRNLTLPDLDTKMIAESFGLSRASLYRLFGPLGGVAGYVRKRRLDRAYQEITAPELANRRIGPIAYRLGFKNVSAFNRVFREAYGVSPGQARATALKGFSATLLRGESAVGDSLGRWLTRIARADSV